MWVLQTLIDLLIPDCCQLCGRSHREAVASPSGLAGLLHRGVGISLLGPLQIRNHPLCANCLRELESSVSLSHPLRVGGLRVVAPFHTNATLLAIAHRIKFAGVSSLCRLIAASMAAAWEQVEAETWTLVPVPMDGRSRRSRGFNPAELLALEVGRLIGSRVEIRLLEKVKHTRTQSLTPRDDRYENVRGAFQGISGNHEDERVILVDDFVTSGATALECARALARIGVIPDAVLCAGEAL